MGGTKLENSLHFKVVSGSRVVDEKDDRDQQGKEGCIRQENFFHRKSLLGWFCRFYCAKKNSSVIVNRKKQNTYEGKWNKDLWVESDEYIRFNQFQICS